MEVADSLVKKTGGCPPSVRGTWPGTKANATRGQPLLPVVLQFGGHSNGRSLMQFPDTSSAFLEYLEELFQLIQHSFFRLRPLLAEQAHGRKNGCEV